MDIKCFIHGEEYRLADTYSITQQGGAVSSSSIDIKVGTGQDVPRSLMDVTLYFDTTPFSGGSFSQPKRWSSQQRTNR